MFLPEALRFAGGPGLAPPSNGVRLEEIELKIEGMGCEACETMVRSIIETGGGVFSTQVNYETGSAAITVADGWGFSPHMIQQRLREHGYELQINSTQS